MLNEKMHTVATAIEETIIHILPVKYQLIMFDGRIELKDIISQVLLECCEYAYSKNADQISLRQHRKVNEDEHGEYAEDYIRMRFQRAATYMNQHSEALCNYVGKEYGFRIKNPAYDKKDNKYAINALDFLDLTNVDEIDFFKVIIDRKFLSQKFYNDNFRAYAANYDMICSKMRKKSEGDAEATVINSLSMFTLEWQFYFDFLYELAEEMEKNHVREIPDMKERLTAFCYEPTIVSALSYDKAWPFPGELTVISRSVLLRRKFVHDIVSKGPGEDYAMTQAVFLEALYITELIQIAMLYNEMPLREWFAKKTEIGDWASVFSDYDVFQALVPDKKWTNKKIRYVKEMYKELTFDYGA